MHLMPTVFHFISFKMKLKDLKKIAYIACCEIANTFFCKYVQHFQMFYFKTFMN